MRVNSLLFFHHQISIFTNHILIFTEELVYGRCETWHKTKSLLFEVPMLVLEVILDFDLSVWISFIDKESEFHFYFYLT
jgi:hypothetical protein